jgi:hypothetical protein
VTSWWSDLQCDPVYRDDWTTPERPVVNLIHQYIVPSWSTDKFTEYRVQSIDGTCALEEQNFSEPLVIHMPIWGDNSGPPLFPPPAGPPDHSVDITTDVTCALDKFKNIATGCAKARADVEPDKLDYIE